MRREGRRKSGKLSGFDGLLGRLGELLKYLILHFG